MEAKEGESVRRNDRRQQIVDLLCQRRSDTVQNLASANGPSAVTLKNSHSLTPLRQSVADMAEE